MVGKHPIRWFEHRQINGIEICRDVPDLFTPPIYIASKDHAKALHASQDKGFRYKEILTVKIK